MKAPLTESQIARKKKVARICQYGSNRSILRSWFSAFVSLDILPFLPAYPVNKSDCMDGVFSRYGDMDLLRLEDE